MNESASIAEKRFQASKRVGLVGGVVNLVLAVVKVSVGILGQSQSLVADGIHSLTDLLTDILVVVTAHHARQEPDSDHPYGHGRFETLATMALGALLIIVAGGIIWDAFARMFSPEQLLIPKTIALWAAAFSILANEGLYYYTLHAGRRVNSDLLLANAWHHRSDSISSIVVLIGIGGTLAGLPYLDAVAAAVVGAIIIKIGWQLGWRATHELADMGLEEARTEEIRRTILSVGGVRDLHLLRTRSLGGHASMDVHVQVEPRLSVSEGHMISMAVEERVKAEIEEIEDVTVHIDPEDDDEALLCVGLPLRSEALLLLEEAWKSIDGAGERGPVILHYLGGKIEVDVFFPPRLYKDQQQHRELEARLCNAILDMPPFRSVRLFFAAH